VYYMCHPSHPPRFDHPIIIWRRAQVMKVRIMQFISASYHFLPLGSKYSPQHPPSTFFPVGERPSFTPEQKIFKVFHIPPLYGLRGCKPQIIRLSPNLECKTGRPRCFVNLLNFFKQMLLFVPQNRPRSIRPSFFLAIYS